MFRLAVKDLLAHKLRLLTTALAVMLGVAFMAGTLTLTDTIRQTLDNLYAAATKNTDAQVRAVAPFKDRRGNVRPRVPADLVPTVARVTGVAAASGTIQGYAQLVDKHGKAVGKADNGPPVLGFKWDPDPRINPFTLVEGHPPAAPDQVVIDRGTARQTGYTVGDRATVLIQGPAQPVTIVGIATFGSQDNAAGSSAVLFTDATAQRLVARPHTYDAIAVVAQPGVTQTELRDRIAKILPAGVEAITGKALTAENQQTARQQTSMFNTFLLAFAVIALFVGAFIIFNTFSILVAQRTRDTALLRALGASRRQVLTAVILEATAVGAVAAVAGIGLGVGVAIGLKVLLAAGFGLDIPGGGLAITPKTIIVSAVTGLGVSVISALAPARKASTVAPIAAMRDVAAGTYRPSKQRIVIGAAVTAAGVTALAYGLLARPTNTPTTVAVGAAAVFIGTGIIGPAIARPLSRLLGSPLPRLRGITGQLARHNAMRNPKRTSATAAALTIGVGLIGFITVFAASAKDSYRANVGAAFTGDFVIDSGSYGVGGLPPTLAQQLTALPQIKIAAAQRESVAQVHGATKQLEGIDPISFPTVMNLHVTHGRLQNLDNHGIAVVDTLAATNGWKLGDTIDVRFALTGTQKLTIAAIFTDKIQGRPLIIALPTYQANVADQFDTRIYVQAAAGTSAGQARAALQNATAAYPTAKIDTREQYISTQLTQINKILSLIYLLLAFAVLISLMGITNTLALSIVERTHELGLLRAVGMTRRQLRDTIRYESIIIALLGTTLGLLIGLGFGWGLVHVLSDQGIHHLTIPVAQLGIITAIAALASTTAAALPALRASRLDPLQAIATT